MKNLWLFLFLLLTSSLYAQEKVVGTVYSSDDMAPLPGVNIIIQGTGTGVITDMNGEYSINISTPQDILSYSFLGFQTQEIVVGDNKKIDVTLYSDFELMGDVVVTALGIERDKKALGYSVSKIDGKAFENSKSANPMSSLSGRLSGVQITSTGQGQAASTSVIIRGNAIADGSNQPLYVVDGVPISNNQYQNADSKDHGGVDSGNGMSGIAADDIESISVLKGAAATALYGSRAINGVVMVTTKSGKGEEGTTIDFNSTTTVEQARVYSDWQDVYGQENAYSSYMWGAKYADVDTYTDYKGDESPYQFYNNQKDFYEMGATYSNSIALNHNSDNSTIRASYNNLQSDGIVPGTEYDRNTFTINASSKMFDDKLEVRTKLSYISDESLNQMMGSSPYATDLIYAPDNVPVSDLSNYKDPETGKPNGMANNLYWNLNEVSHINTKERIIIMGQAKYNFTSNLSAMVRYGSDDVVFKGETLFPIYTTGYDDGRAELTSVSDSEKNIDGLISYEKSFAQWGLTANVGSSMMESTYDKLSIYDNGFVDPALQGTGFGTEQSHSPEYSKKRINSVFGTAQFSYRSLFFTDITARNDWSSTLPSDNNSYFYPSVSSSLVFSELFSHPKWFSFGKIRASWAKVGSDTDPYRLALNYNMSGNLFPGDGGNAPSGSIANSTVPNKNLKPSMNTSYELGIDVRFFQNRLGVDLTYYDSEANNQIVRVTTSKTSTYESAIINAGAIRNSGLELSIFAEPIKTEHFSWTTVFNYAKNSNEVISLTEGVNQLTLFESTSVNIIAAPGEEYGQIQGTTYLRDDNGEIVVDESGIPQISDGVSVIGDAYHDTMIGWVNRFSYKNWSASFVLDGKFGGEVYSQTEALSYVLGKHQNTLGREEYNAEGWYPSELNGAATTATPYDFYSSVASIDEEFIYDASYLAIQEINLSYSLPSSIFEGNQYFRAVTCGLFARNLGYIWKATDNIDPQASFSIANGSEGVEMGNLALPASYGFNLNIKF